MTDAYANAFAADRATPAFEATPTKQTKQGGHAHVLADAQRFYNFLILGSAKGTYYAKEQEHTAENLAVLKAHLLADGVAAVRTIAEVSVAGRAPKVQPAIAALAYASVIGDAPTKEAVYAAFPRVLRTPYHQILFAKYRQAAGGGSGSGYKRALGRLFNEAAPKDLAFDAIKYKNREGYSYWDLLAMARPEPVDEAHDAMFDYLKTGRLAPGEPRVVEHRPNMQTYTAGVSQLPGEIATYLGAAQELSRLTPAEAKRAVDLIVRHRFPREVVPTELLAVPAVWEALLPNLGLTALLRNFGALSKAGLLTDDSDSLAHASKRLLDVEQLKKARIHPIAILSALKTYESGHAVRGSSSWPVSRDAVHLLDKAFFRAYGAVEPTGKRIRLGLDISASMEGNPVAGLPNVNARELEAAMALVFLNTEKEVDLVAFSETLRSAPIKPAMSIAEAMRVLGSFPHGSTLCPLPIKEAFESGRDFDAFVTMTDNETQDTTESFGYSYGYGWSQRRDSGERGTVSDWLRKYRQKVGHRVTHSVLAFTANDVTIGDPNDPDVCNAAGFDLAVPALVSAHIRG